MRIFRLVAVLPEMHYEFVSEYVNDFSASNGQAVRLYINAKLPKSRNQMANSRCE